MKASGGVGSVFSVVCTDSWPSEIVFEGGIVLASSSREGSAPWIADGSRVDWSGFSFLGPRDINPSASRLASEEDLARVENQGSSALCWWSTMPVSYSGGDGWSSNCSWRAVALRALFFDVGGACPAENDSGGEGLSGALDTSAGSLS